MPMGNTHTQEAFPWCSLYYMQMFYFSQINTCGKWWTTTKYYFVVSLKQKTLQL